MGEIALKKGKKKLISMHQNVETKIGKEAPNVTCIPLL